ncbi:MAG: protein-L-isoaspartate(D-aspartate) O-methyltransferase [Elusimicrobia bacterium]|nr:protein-L-isoaspartate(D-aspartate) O-methyltransferase [Elusimicrobiota bacterium]
MDGRRARRGAPPALQKRPALVNDFESLRARMVDEQLRARGIGDRAVLAAFRDVSRHAFLPADTWPEAYEDRPVPIGLGQTMSQPFIVAYMAQLLELTGDERVLEVGAGSGYAAAILGRLAAEVFAIELEPSLAEAAARALKAAGSANVSVRVGDGTLGWPEKAPFDRIVASAALEKVPEALLAQLAPGGRFLGPVGPGANQRLCVVRRSGEGFETEFLSPVLFVPMRRSPKEGT